MKLIIVFVTIAFLIPTDHISAQIRFSHKIDSLENLLKQTANNQVKLEVLDRLANNYFITNENDRIYEVLKELEDLSIAQQSHIGVIKAYFYYGKIYFERNRDFAKGLKYKKKSVEYAEQNKIENDYMYSSLYNELGLVYKNLHIYDSALYFYQKSLETSKKIDYTGGIISATLNLSRLHKAMGNYYQSIELAKELLQMGLDLKDKEAIYMGYRRLGEAHNEIGAMVAARDYLQQALKLSIELYGEDDGDTFYTYNLLGRVYIELGDFDKAIDYQHRYLSYLRRQYGRLHPTEVGVFSYLGKSFDKLNLYDSAEYYFDLGLRSLDQQKRVHDFAYFNLLRYKLDMYWRMGEREQFLSTAQRALDYDLKDKRRIAGIYKRMGDYHCSVDDVKKGMEFYQKAIQAQIIDFEYADINNNPEAIQIDKNLFVLQVLLAKGKAFERLAKNDVKSRSSLLSKAKNCYLLGDTVIFNAQSFYKSNEDAISFFDTWKRVYGRGIQVSKQLHKIHKDPQYMDLAFYFAERSKATVLSRVSAQRNILSGFGMGDSVRTYQENLKSSIAYQESKLREARLKSDTLQIQELSNLLFGLKNEEEVFNDSLKIRFPEYHNFIYNSGNLLSLSNVKNRLYDRVLIEYTVGEDSIYAFVIDRKRTQLAALAKGDHFDRLLDEHTEAILQKDTEKFNRNAYALYQLLVEPLVTDITLDQELLIVPDDRLWQVNFDLLLTSNETSKDYGKLPYLIKRHPISYANSASLLFNQSRQNDLNTLNQCLAFSYSEDEDFEKSTQIDFVALRAATGDLPGTRQEIRNISNILPGIYYYGDQANESNFKKNVNKYGVVHLAVHGEIDDQDPLYSNLRFSPSETDTLEDNLLHTFEIYDMRFNADLAVLSACNTAQGKLRGGEGIMSLGRAFQYAGVQSLLLSNWEVADKQAPKLMQYFYEGLVNHGYSKSVALQQAKLKYLNTAGVYERAPFYWGNFMILGDPSPIASSSNRSSLLVLFGVLFVFGVLLRVVEH
ncbi:MAG: CHAT domain-containing tetratricopeptide repeat protein [Bacteroidota bacterium]